MDSFEWNKVFGAVLFALLIYLGVQNLVSGLYKTTPANPEAYIVEGVMEEGATQMAAQQTEDIIPIETLLADASIEKGMKVAKKCISCHGFAKGDMAKTGPGLWGIVGRDIASAAGFSFSDALNGIDGVWDYEKLAAFLENPKKFAKGTNMAFVGLRKAKDRADIIAYLDSLKD